VSALLRVPELAVLDANTTFVDIGCGVGRAAILMNLLTGATAVGVEIQPHLVAIGNAVTQRLALSRVNLKHGDACDGELLPEGDVYFMYCPFDAARVKQVLALLERRARRRTIAVVCLQVNIPECSWLSLGATESADLRIYRSRRV
jgi:SAM-dependent methyltransferase